MIFLVILPNRTLAKRHLYIESDGKMLYCLKWMS